MEFLIWHYGPGLNRYLRRWLYILGWINHFFSLPLLLPSLFSPWKRLTDMEDTPGFNFERAFRQLTFNLTSRFIGAFVRLFLLLFGLILLIPVLLIGLIGFIFWLFIPFIGLPYYLLSDPHAKRFMARLGEKLRADPQSAVSTVFSTPPGRFVLSHVGLELSDLLANSQVAGLQLADFSPASFTQVIHKLIESEVWSKSYLRSKNVDYSDLTLAGRWWDSKYGVGEAEDVAFHYTRPGIGLDLLFGYTPVLNQYSTDLSVTQPFVHHLIGRKDLSLRMERSLSSSSSVILVGQPGVGKKTIVLEFARRCMAGELGSNMSYQRVLELDYNFLLAGSLDINQKKSYLSSILHEAASAGNVILVIKDLHRLTDQSVEGVDFTDLFEKHLERRKLRIIAISTQEDYDKYLASNSRLKKYFDPIEAEPVSPEDALEILMDFASWWESSRRLTITTQSLRAIIQSSGKYITDTPFPEKALEILDAVVSFVDKKDSQVVTVDDVNSVVAETTGISLARLTQKERQLLGDLESLIHKRLVGQDAAVSLISKSLRSRAVGVKSENRPLGSFLFLGPTGVGKTETAKTLANVYFGSPEFILRFDMAEFAGSEGLERLIGSVSKNEPGKLTTSIKNRPASLLLLDEIEKAPPQIFNLFLSLLDEGQLTDAFGHKINCKNLFVIATSNAGAEFIRQKVHEQLSPDQLQKQVIDFVQKQGIFSPEFLNRFDGVVVFEPLSQDQLQTVAKLMLEDLASSLDQKDITLTFTPEVLSRLAAQGYEPEFGARPMRRIVDITIGDVIGRRLLSEEVKAGDHIVLDVEGPEGYTVRK